MLWKNSEKWSEFLNNLTKTFFKHYLSWMQQKFSRQHCLEHLFHEAYSFWELVIFESRFNRLQHEKASFNGGNVARAKRVEHNLIELGCSLLPIAGSEQHVSLKIHVFKHLSEVISRHPSSLFFKIWMCVDEDSVDRLQLLLALDEVNGACL